MEAELESLSVELQRIKRYLALYQEKPLAEKLAHADPLPSLSTVEKKPLQTLCQRLSLSPFDRDILLLCAGVELDPEIADWLAHFHQDPQQTSATFSVALRVLPDGDWAALSPSAPLRKWQLVDIGPGHQLTTSPLRINERILHYLLGSACIDEMLGPYVYSLTDQDPQDRLVASHQQLVEQGIQCWQSIGHAVPIIQLAGLEKADKYSIIQSICQYFGLDPYRVSLSSLPTPPRELDQFGRLWMREAMLMNHVLVVDCDQISLDVGDPQGRQNAGLLYLLLQQIWTPVIISTLQSKDIKRELCPRSLLTLEVESPTLAEQRHLWQTHLRDYSHSLNGHLDPHLDTLIGHFNLSSRAIQSACEQALGTAKDPAKLPQILWQTCRQHARQSTGHLIQQIEATAEWEDLILTDVAQQVLVDIAAHVRQRLRVYHEWGFAKKTSRGMGISALFAGASGTGKTMAAEILAKTLNLDLYRVDLSGVVSKYIGETEKNLRQVFAIAEAGGSILLFDEADALFGKRSDVKDSHDRYANMEVSYLLQQMESYQGLSILTTNLKDSIDTAFMRRIRFVVRFTFPDPEQRAQIWRRIFPCQTPTQGLNYTKLACLQVSGGNIRNIALNAAFIAADAGEPVQMIHILQAARQEYIKLEKTLTESEIKGWI